MKDLSFAKFALLCSNKRVICHKSNLRADFDKNALEQTARINKLTGSNLSFDSDSTVYVGGDNDREGYEITENTFSFIQINEEENLVIAGFSYRDEKVSYSVSEWAN
jgi:hypothetical protein